ncbi:MAG: nicotinate (nicotinamide) nucleotide adenylyltransferase [Planctomycetes bacterium]|nr:nicotinate (nicotinamide) nucleotide adenylyltransferase [Planctomycetota bacterium]
MMPTLLIFGGTFDPPHRAHTELPPLVADQLDCDRILYVMASLNPLKADSPPTSAEHRLAMLEIAISDLPKAEICTLELDRPGPSYAVQTLEQLREAHGTDVGFYLLLGSDQALQFTKWKDWEHILELATPVVMLRPPLDIKQFEQQLSESCPPKLLANWLEWIADLPQLDISATEIRQRFIVGKGFDDSLDPRVLAYIKEHGLYLI